MINPFDNRTPSLSGPAMDILPVTPNDGANLSTVALGLYVENGGAVTMITIAGQQRTVVVTNFSILPVGTMAVKATGTTATGIHALVLT